MSQRSRQYAICTYTRGDQHLVAWKVYKVLPDEQAAEDNYLRVVDESGEDYLYPGNYFAPIDLSKEAERALRGKPARRVAAARR